jgi:hypothetical protein
MSLKVPSNSVSSMHDNDAMTTLNQGDVFHDPPWLPKTTERTEPYT